MRLPRLLALLAHRAHLAHLALLSVVVLSAAPLGAQRIAPSQRGSVTQTVAFTDVSIVYGRPVARGRTLFGGIVPWNDVWHPGADSASRIAFTHDVRVEGRDVKAGEYSVWLVPREHAPWTVILSRSARAWHRNYPGEAQDALRVDVPIERGTHMESLAYYFPAVDADSATLRIHWGETIVPLKLVAPWRTNGG